MTTLPTASARFANLFAGPKPILAMLHLKGDEPADVLARAMREADILISHGVDGLVVEDYFGSRHDVEVVLDELASQSLPVPYGVNVLDDGPASFELAERYGAGFVQMDSIAGHLAPAQDLPFAAAIQRIRRDSSALLLGGVRFKYQPVLSGNSLDVDLRVAMGRCDAVVVTGDRTGGQTPGSKIREFRSVLGPDFPLVVGAGVTVDNCREQLLLGDAAIVGSSLKDTGEATGEISTGAVADFMAAVREVRASAGAVPVADGDTP